ncbi:efflux RND transporter periplasmic adaptor subunit [Comamonas terrigena]|uniref:efflux RND transporter periplasmic adaptor subunit n=1 Tax=Comamonas terrigena TaxID=32013 RepID=UPI002448CA4C|nr:efflux RND transporter periplasmic adaptor subunit [Comamonas terrigena]MDH0051382.1 efflux RND transporter periplasmic adaptor subunit [Comamonas terrigena]MDH0513794.1 efflux RND transporter periplasmic adaptor subunit [Comamonas terrigena]MDH1093331.1 efflux RND transporter periplasmic adaptor subunit [Comamonas terrigena]MDH1293389.1 efflux RND transporter periplasmic adaptor subunit [Comamonas terrigena]MDH1502920.1 efflux RND transporter periplasmic adaptor subunit [Comamonas terrigen
MLFRFSQRAFRLAVLAIPCLIAAPLAAQAADSFSVSAAQMQSLGVQLQRIDKSGASLGQSYSARVVLAAGQEQIASAPLSGVIDQLLVAENDVVKIGQPLMRIASPELGELQLKLMEADASSRLSQRTLKRERELFSEGIIPERRVQEAEAAASQDAARKRQAEAALRLAGWDSSKFQGVLEKGNLDASLTVRSKAAGTVTDLSVKLGQRVQQADVLMRVANTGKLGLDIQIPAARASQVALTKGAPVVVLERSGVQGAVLSVGPSVSDTQILALKAAVTKGAELLRPGEVVQVQVPFSAGQEGWTVPLTSVVRQGDKAYVFVRNSTGFTAVPVNVLASAGQTVQITGALQAGQEVAIASVIALKAAWQGKGGGD